MKESEFVGKYKFTVIRSRGLWENQIYGVETQVWTKFVSRNGGEPYWDWESPYARTRVPTVYAWSARRAVNKAKRAVHEYEKHLKNNRKHLKVFTYPPLKEETESTGDRHDN